MAVKGASAPLLGLVLSGGGARGAYEAGVIKYLRDELPVQVRSKIKFDIMCGTSIGAINSCFLAAESDSPDTQGKALAAVWQSLQINSVYKVGWREIFNLPKFILGSRGRGELDELVGHGRLGGLFNTYPLEKLVHRTINWDKIKTNINLGHLQALAINATNISTGITHVFVQTNQPESPPSRDPQIKTHWLDITPSHALASSALPWIFPSVEINGEIYCDGALKLNTPISPALRLGADRLFVIGLRSQNPQPQAVASFDSYPSAAFLLGKIFNALMLDKTDYDLMQLERFNALLEAGKIKFGEDFAHELADIATDLRGGPYRKIDHLVVRPSVDLSTIAERHLKSGVLASRAGGLVGPFIRRMGDAEEGQTKDLLSYLLFDGEFATDLIDLGMADADSMRQQLIDFFDI